MTVPTTGNGTDDLSNRAADALRGDIVPSTVGELDGVQAYTTGEASATGDFNDAMIGHLPLVFAFVLSAAFLLLLVTFRSIVIPLKAIVLNMLSVGSAYGLMTLVFQNGLGESIGLGSGPIAAWLPLFLFVILFGLSMDYHVFILTRIREAFDRGMSTSDAVAHGIKSTAGTVTSAAIVMVAVFSMFALSSELQMQQMGIGLAAAVLIDATIIRGDSSPRDDEAPGRLELVAAEQARLAAQAGRGAGGDARRRLNGESGGAVNRTPRHRKTERESRPLGAILRFMDPSKNLAARAGRWSAQHRKKAILGWLTFVILAVVVGGSFGTKTLGDGDFGIGESGRADKVVSDHFKDKGAESVLIQSRNGVRTTDPQFRSVVDEVVGRLKRTENAQNVKTPYGRDSAGQLSEDGRSALVTFELPGDNPADKVDPSLDAVSALADQHGGYRIEQFGDGSADKALTKAFADDFKKAEFTSLPITLVILILAFGALLAAFVPLLLAITAVAAAIGLIGPLSQIWPVDESISSVVLLIGLAVGVDYSMFYLRREREERARGRSEEAALEAASATSGRAVLVSGITVIAAMAGMYFGGAATFMSFATGTILVVAIAVIGSLTVLPAILSKLGDRVNKGRVPFLAPERRTGEARAWGWVLDRVLRRPLVAIVAAGAVLVVLATPLLHIHTADSGVDGLPRSLPIMQTYDRMQAAFPGETFSADIVIQGDRLDRSEIRAAAAEVRGVARRVGPLPGAGDGGLQPGRAGGRGRAAARRAPVRTSARRRP